MPIVGRIRPNEQSARAHANNEESDWTPAPCTYAGSGAPVPAELLPVQHLTEPLEMEDGRWFVPDVPGSSHRNDNQTRKDARRADAIEQSQIKRDLRDPPRSVVVAESGIVERPGKAKARDVG